MEKNKHYRQLQEELFLLLYCCFLAAPLEHSVRCKEGRNGRKEEGREGDRRLLINLQHLVIQHFSSLKTHWSLTIASN